MCAEFTEVSNDKTVAEQIAFWCQQKHPQNMSKFLTDVSIAFHVTPDSVMTGFTAKVYNNGIPHPFINTQWTH